LDVSIPYFVTRLVELTLYLSVNLLTRTIEVGLSLSRLQCSSNSLTFTYHSCIYYRFYRDLALVGMQSTVGGKFCYFVVDYMPIIVWGPAIQFFRTRALYGGSRPITAFILLVGITVVVIGTVSSNIVADRVHKLIISLKWASTGGVSAREVIVWHGCHDLLPHDTYVHHPNRCDS
jgi:hypothetical protein